MKIEIIKSKENTYKIISRVARKNPILSQFAEFLKQNNKISPVKAGIYAVTGGWLENGITVYSYISGKKERMTKQQYYKWLRGKRQMGVKKEKSWLNDTAKTFDIEELLK